MNDAQTWMLSRVVAGLAMMGAVLAMDAAVPWPMRAAYAGGAAFLVYVAESVTRDL